MHLVCFYSPVIDSTLPLMCFYPHCLKTSLLGCSELLISKLTSVFSAILPQYHHLKWFAVPFFFNHDLLDSHLWTTKINFKISDKNSLHGNSSSKSNHCCKISQLLDTPPSLWFSPRYYHLDLKTVVAL